MATKKASSTTKKKSPTSKATAAKKTTTKKTVAKKVASVRAASTTVAKTSYKAEPIFPSNIANIILAEVIGTAILTFVAIMAASATSSLFVGLAMMMIGFTVFAISGAHVNPAVTVGLVAMRKLKPVMLIPYLGAQFVGALVTLGVMYLLTNGHYTAAFDKIFDFGNINGAMFAIEAIGTGVYMFGVAAIAFRSELSTAAKSFGIGLSLAVGLFVASAMLTQVQTADYATYQAKSTQQSTENDGKNSIPHSLRVKGAVLNPAIAVAATESTESQLTTGSLADGEVIVNRFSPEVYLSTLIGAAIGGNLFLLLTWRPRE